MRGEIIEFYDAAAEELVEKAIDRNARRVGDTLDDVVGNEGVTGAVLEHGEKQDDVPW